MNMLSDDDNIPPEEWDEMVRKAKNRKTWEKLQDELWQEKTVARQKRLEKIND